MKMESEKSAGLRPHVVALPFPAQGHISPLMHLCKRIAAAGFTVSYVTPDSLHNQMKLHWKPPPGLDIRLDSLPFQPHIPHAMDTHAVLNLAWFFDAVADMSQHLHLMLQRFKDQGSPACCIISDFFLPWTQQVADAFGIPRVVLWAAGATWAAFEHHTQTLRQRGYLPTKESDLDEERYTIDFIPALAPLRPADIPTYMRSQDQHWIELTLARSDTLHPAAAVLVNSFHELEQLTFDEMVKQVGPKFVPVGPLFLLDGENLKTGPRNVILREENQECMSWLDMREKGSVIYISFGSLAALSMLQFEELAAALERCGYPFLWVVRPELFLDYDEEFRAKYTGFCERNREVGMTIDWGAQLQILEHPSVGAFLTHCGWNSMIESLSNGVPMIGWPWGAEQNSNCKVMVEEWIAGCKVSTKGYFQVVDRKEVERAIREVMVARGDEYRGNVQRLMSLARKTVEEDGLSYINVDKFVNIQLRQWSDIPQ